LNIIKKTFSIMEATDTAAAEMNFNGKYEEEKTDDDL
jgi:hypothetical protein